MPLNGCGAARAAKWLGGAISIGRPSMMSQLSLHIEAITGCLLPETTIFGNRHEKLSFIHVSRLQLQLSDRLASKVQVIVDMAPSPALLLSRLPLALHHIGTHRPVIQKIVQSRGLRPQMRLLQCSPVALHPSTRAPKEHYRLKRTGWTIGDHVVVVSSIVVILSSLGSIYFTK